VIAHSGDDLGLSLGAAAAVRTAAKNHLAGQHVDRHHTGVISFTAPLQAAIARSRELASQEHRDEVDPGDLLVGAIEQRTLGCAARRDGT
jgi:hypothetical protein